VLEWVFSRGCTARPLEPELLVNVWQSNIEEMHLKGNELTIMGI
jgi:hypothetical protein